MGTQQINLTNTENQHKKWKPLRFGFKLGLFPSLISILKFMVLEQYGVVQVILREFVEIRARLREQSVKGFIWWL